MLLNKLPMIPRPSTSYFFLLVTACLVAWPTYLVPLPDATRPSQLLDFVGDSRNHRSVLSTPLLSKNNGNSTKPYFILHVGPPKTATTTIQCALQDLSQELAEWDTTYYLGRQCGKYPTSFPNGEESLSGDLKGNLQKGYGVILDAFQARLAYHRHYRRHNVVLSMEGMSRALLYQDEDADENDEGLMRLAALLGDDWNVQIVVTYRPYFEWIRSFYSQELREEHAGSKFSWDYRHSSFQEYLQRHLESATRKKHIQGLGHHLSVRTNRAYARYFRNVKFFDLYQANNRTVVTNFICQNIPSAGKTCRYLQDSTTQRRFKDHKYESDPFDALRILEAAYDQGLINSTRRPKKNILSRRVQEELGQHVGSDMVRCLPTITEEAFLRISLSFEKEMLELRGMYAPEKLRSGEHDHRLAFERAKAAGNFCEIDPARVLYDEKWRQFLSNL
jgi:hypothetical protein